MKTCINKDCLAKIDNSTRFCPECGSEQPAQKSDENPIYSAGIGDKNVISGGVIGKKEEIHAQNYTVNKIEDDTKKMVECCVSGKRVSIAESAICKSCQGEVAIEYFNAETLRCRNCEDKAKYDYKEEVEKVFQKGLMIDSATREGLDRTALALQLSKEISSKIEQTVKSSLLQSNKKELSRGQEREFKFSLEQIIEKGRDENAFKSIKSIAKDSNDQTVQYWYYLLEAIWYPQEAISLFEKKEIDIYWQHYWVFLAYLHSNFGFASKVIDNNRDFFGDKANEILLAEVLYCLRRGFADNNQSSLNEANAIAKELQKIPYAPLDGLVKSIEYTLANIGNLDVNKTSGLTAFYLKEVLAVPVTAKKEAAKPNQPAAPTPAKPVSPPAKSKEQEIADKKAQFELEQIELQSQVNRAKAEKEIEDLKRKKSEAAKSFAPISTPTTAPKTEKSRIGLWVGVSVAVAAVLYFVVMGGDGAKESVDTQQPPQTEVTETPKTIPANNQSPTTTTAKPTNAKPTTVSQQAASQPAQPQASKQTQQESSPTVKPQAQTSQPAANVPVAEKSATDLYQEGLSAYKKFNYSQAASSFSKAVEKGDAGAQFYLGMMHLEGNGVSKSSNTAFSYIQKAANAGHKEAIYQLAQMYDGGLGTEKDKAQARTWYQKAADMGNASAKRRLESL